MKNQIKRKSKKKQKNVFKKRLRKKLTRVLLNHMGWHKSIANFVAGLACALLSICNVWHKRLAQASDSDAKIESTTRRIQRFFVDCIINYHCFSTMLYQLLSIKEKLTIILDRTNWAYGKKQINIFVAAVLYKHISINQTSALPLTWEVFSKKGNSHTSERKQLLEKLFAIVGKENIEVVLGDREFIGDEWIKFLHENKIHFVLRIRKMMFVEYNGKRVNAFSLVSNVKYKKKLEFNVVMCSIPVRLMATRSIEGEPVIVIASMGITFDPLDHYKFRWMIELFFKSTKSKGFNLENTHMTDPQRIKLLFGLVALASICAVQAGIIKNHFKKISIKNHGRPLYSIFTYGLDFLKELFEGHTYDWLPNDFLLMSPDQKPIFALGMG